MIKRVFYSSGPGNIIESHHCWKQNKYNPTEVSVTFSSQIQDFCKAIGANAYFVSTRSPKAKLADGEFILEHRPKRSHSGARFHVDEILYGLGLLATALRFRAQIALIDSGSTHYFVMALFRIAGIKVVPILHNTLWPTGFPPTRAIPRLVLRLDSLFFSWVPTALIAVSPECERQVDSVRGKKRYTVYQTRAQFDPNFFARIPPPPPHERRPFQIMFIGRISRVKGVFDILEIAKRIEDKYPKLIQWEICGRGVDFEELTVRHRQLHLDGIVNLRGWTSLDDLVNVYTKSHASIVPTRSSFIEGLAMTAAEAILAGRPVVTNPVVPALEIMRSACSEAITNDTESHLQAVLKLATDAEFYRNAQAACVGYQHQFYDRNFGMAAVLKRALAAYL